MWYKGEVDPKLWETGLPTDLNFKKECIKFRMMVAFLNSAHQVDSYKTPDQI